MSNMIEAQQENKEPRAEAFTFGDPTPVLSRRDLVYMGCWFSGGDTKYYEPPVDQQALSQLYHATAHHGSALQVKRNVLSTTFIPTKFLSRSDFISIALDYVIFGEFYVQKIKNRFGKLIKVKPSKALYTRRDINLKDYWWTGCVGEDRQFDTGSIIHIMEPDTRQEVYGVPDYLGALGSILLNESATLFRRKYYENGSHAGFILYMTDAAQEQEDIDGLRKALKDSKGPGNFRNLFMYAPNGKKDGIQLIPVSEVAAKDNFSEIKDTSRDDQLAGHRVPPQIMGIMPSNTGGFGDAEKAAKIFARNEIVPLQHRFEELNDILGEKVVEFKPYKLEEDEEA